MWHDMKIPQHHCYAQGNHAGCEQLNQFPFAASTCCTWQTGWLISTSSRRFAQLPGNPIASAMHGTETVVETCVVIWEIVPSTLLMGYS